MNHHRMIEQLAGEPADVRRSRTQRIEPRRVTRGIRFAVEQLDLRVEPRERRAHLVRGVGDEALHRVDPLGKAVHQAIDRPDDRVDLARRIDGHRSQVGRVARGDDRADLRERAQATPDREAARADREYAHQQDQRPYLDAHVVRQLLARVGCLRNRHERPARRAFLGHEARDRCGAHPMPLVDGVRERGALLRGGERRGAREIVVPSHDHAARIDHLVVDEVVARQRRQRGHRRIQREHAALHVEVFGDLDRCAGEQLVVRAFGRDARVVARDRRERECAGRDDERDEQQRAPEQRLREPVNARQSDTPSRVRCGSRPSCPAASCARASRIARPRSRSARCRS